MSANEELVKQLKDAIEDLKQKNIDLIKSNENYKQKIENIVYKLLHLYSLAE